MKNNENKKHSTLRNSKNSKKSQISIQFNWMLVLIIGAIILTFFITIVQKQKEYSEESIAGTIQTDLQAILNSAHVSTSTSSIVEFPNKKIAFGCEGFKVGNQFAAKFPYAFAPDLIKSDRNTISIFAYDWSVPYRVTNFLYVTSPDVRYIIDDDASTIDLANALNELLPPRYIIKGGQSKLFMNKEIASPVGDTNNYKIRVIYFTDPSPFNPGTTFGNTKEKDISALYITPNCGGTPEEQLNCDGTLRFFNYNTSNGQWGYKNAGFVGKAALLAAIFSENSETYGCGIDNAFERLKSVTTIYQNRTTNLRDFYGSGTCYDKLNDTLLILDNIYSAASTKDDSSIYTYSQNLESENDVILALSCNTIY